MLRTALLDPRYLMGFPASVKLGTKRMPPGAGTLAFTGKQVGPGCANEYHDVMAVQQLLAAAGEGSVGAADGHWGKKTTSNTATALQSFMNKHGSPEQRRTSVLRPNDDLLLLMAQLAKLVIPLSGKTGFEGVWETHRWLNDKGIKYNAGAQKHPPEGNRALFGVRGHRGCVVQTKSGGFAGARPIELDCTTYVNLLLSIYLYGDAHTKYQASCELDSREKHLCTERYGFPVVMRGNNNYFADAAQIAAATSAVRSALFVIEVGGESQAHTSHMALLHGSRVYECTTGQSGAACIDSPLDDFVTRLFKKGKKPLYLLGPR